MMHDRRKACQRITSTTVAVIGFIVTVQGHETTFFDLQTSITAHHQLDINTTTWSPPVPSRSVGIKLLPANELRATTSDRKQIVVHVTAVGVGEVAPPCGRILNCDNSTTGNGYSTRFV